MSKKVIFVTLILVLLSSYTLPVLTQDFSKQRIDDRVERLEKELNDLQFYLYKKPHSSDLPKQPHGSSSPAITQNNSDKNTSDIIVKLDQISEEISRLRGRVEEMEYKHARQRDMLSRLTQDIEFRFSQIQSNSQPNTQNNTQKITKQIDQQNKNLVQEISSNDNKKPISMQNHGSPNHINTTSHKNSGTGNVKILGEIPVKNTTGDIQLHIQKKKGNAVPHSSSVTNTPSTPENLYKTGFDLLQQRKYSEAVIKFEEFIAHYPDHKLISDVHYWVGETYYSQGNHAQAAKSFVSSYKKSPTGKKAANSLLKLGVTLGVLGKNEEACTTFTELKTKFQNAPKVIKTQAHSESQKLKCPK